MRGFRQHELVVFHQEGLVGNQVQTVMPVNHAAVEEGTHGIQRLLGLMQGHFLRLLESHRALLNRPALSTDRGESEVMGDELAKPGAQQTLVLRFKAGGPGQLGKQQGRRQRLLGVVGGGGEGACKGGVFPAPPRVLSIIPVPILGTVLLSQPHQLQAWHTKQDQSQHFPGKKLAA